MAVQFLWGSIRNFFIPIGNNTIFIRICTRLIQSDLTFPFLFFFLCYHSRFSQDVLKQTASSLDEMLYVSGRDACEHTAAAALTELRNNNNHHMKNKSISNPNAIVTSILSRNHIDHLEANSVSVIPIDAADNGKQNNGSIISGGLPNTQQPARIKGKREREGGREQRLILQRTAICCVCLLCPFPSTASLASFSFVSFVAYVCEPQFNDFFLYLLVSLLLAQSTLLQNNTKKKKQ